MALSLFIFLCRNKSAKNANAFDIDTVKHSETKSKVLTGKGVSDVEKDIGHANGNSVVIVVVAGNGGSKAVKAKFLSSSCSAATSHTTTDDVASLFWEEDTKIISNNVLAEVDKWIERLDRLVIAFCFNILLTSNQSTIQRFPLDQENRLSFVVKFTFSVNDYLRSIRLIANELALIGYPVNDLDLVIAFLNGLGSLFCKFTI
ncbi:hypothetical protein JHK85_027943 [Glycine max]|nr:hypothetical protein JHK85_027943 [Glycine max]KAG5003293.1 hypothetical protein JHK86_027432 [Glycine max]